LLLLKHDKRSKANATQRRLMKLAGCRCVLLDTSTWLLNDVQVKWSWSVAWIFAYGIKTWHASARLDLRHSVTG